MNLENPRGAQGLNTAPVPSTRKGNHKDKEQSISDRRLLPAIIPSAGKGHRTGTSLGALHQQQGKDLISSRAI